MSTELIEMFDEDGKVAKALRFCTSERNAKANTPDDRIRVQVTVGSKLVQSTFAFDRHQWAEFSKAVQEAFDEYPLKDDWLFRSWMARLQILSDESGILASLLRENKDVVQMIREGASKKACLTFINDNF